jgi:wyosine [tRNA(Phe)-imidazoG37] synthetase (radical SAM superfamily)
MKNRIYGPVSSRRLGRSLGVDCVPFKTCSYDCLYCQLGKSAKTTISRQPYVAIDTILNQLKKKLEQGVRADFITLGGSGEPTLHSEIGPLIRTIKKITHTPVAVLTNGSLLSDPVVQQALTHADVVLPSLDAHTEKDFQIINRPHPTISFDDMVEGLISFGETFPGQIWLEIFILEKINDTEEDAQRFKMLIDRMDPSKVHLNTAVRPVTEPQARQVSLERMEAFSSILGSKAEIAFNVKKLHEKAIVRNVETALLGLLERRPCTLEDLASGLGIEKKTIKQKTDRLRDSGHIETVEKGAKIYYQPVRRNREH